MMNLFKKILKEKYDSDEISEFKNKQYIESSVGVDIKKLTAFSYTFDYEVAVWGKNKKLAVLINESEKDSDITDNQKIILENFFRCSQKYFDKIKEHIINYVLSDKQSGNMYIPDPLPEDVEKFVSANGIHITSEKEGCKSFLFLTFNYKYDPEGICVKFEGERIIEVTTQDILAY